MSKKLTYSYNMNQPDREIFFTELCPCKDDSTNLKNTKTFHVNKRYILDDNKGDLKINSTVKRFLDKNPKYLSTTNLILTDSENGSIEFTNPDVYYNETQKCFRGVYNKEFKLLGIGISKNFLGKQYVIDVQMFDSGLRNYTVTEK